MQERIKEVYEQYNIPEGSHYSPEGPGKYDGKPFYFLYYWGLAQEGFSCFDTELDDGTWVSNFKVSKEEEDLIPGLKEELSDHPDKRNLRMWEDTNGFLHYEWVDDFGN